MSEYSEYAIDSFIRSHLTDNYRVSSAAIEPFSSALESYVEEVILRGWERAQANDRTTIQPGDVDVEQVPQKESLHLPMTPTRRVVKAALPETARISPEAVLAVTGMLEEYGETVVQSAELFMRHADRKTLSDADIDLYFSLFSELPE